MGSDTSRGVTIRRIVQPVAVARGTVVEADGEIDQHWIGWMATARPRLRPEAYCPAVMPSSWSDFRSTKCCWAGVSAEC